MGVHASSIGRVLHQRAGWPHGGRKAFARAVATCKPRVVGWLARLWVWLLAPPPGARLPSSLDDEPEAGSSDQPVVMPIEESIDLHHYAPRDIPSVVEEYLLEARKKGYVEVRIIHGRGKGVQRTRVQKQLERHPAVASFRSDGLGSTLATLHPPKRRAAKSKER
jgi:hypothetical protein